MSNPIQNILRAATRTLHEPLNILCWDTHERYQISLCKTGHNFWSVCGGQNIKTWNKTYGEIPDNYIRLNGDKGDKQLPTEIDFDLILSQHKFGQIQTALNLSNLLHIPIINLEHTLPPSEWTQSKLDYLKSLKGNINVFISEYSRDKWGYLPQQSEVIHHGIDTDLFKPDNSKPKELKCLSVVNDLINRNWCCGYDLWKEVVNGLPHHIVGDTPGLSVPAKDINELVNFYQTSSVFLNTSLISPIPTVVLEAMSCGLPIVSTNNCMLPEIITHEKDGFLSNEPQKLREYCQILLNDRNLAEKMGNEARQTILNRFTLNRFVDEWKNLFYKASHIPYLGN